jgi:hypothetical protein
LAPDVASLYVSGAGAHLGLGLRRQACPEQVEVVDRRLRSVAGKVEKVQIKPLCSDRPSPGGVRRTLRRSH